MTIMIPQINHFNQLKHVAIIWILQHVVVSEELQEQDRATEDYCWLESFQPKCLKNEVILMKGATYGRMRIGRCLMAEEVDAHRSAVGDDPRYFGCSEDVLAILDRKCSGKAECDIRLSDISVENVKPCFPGLTLYLEVSYTCISIADESRSCSVAVSTNPIHITGSKTCGTTVQPWMIEAPPGQKIILSLLDLTDTWSDRVIHDRQLCYGVIVDKVGKRNTTICVKGRERDGELYSSTGNAVEIIFNTSRQERSDVANDRQEFILKIETKGCSDLIPPEDAWLKRNNDAIVIGCYASRKTWHLNCIDGKWIGVIGNCSRKEEHLSFHDPVSKSDLRPTKKNSWSNEQVVGVVAIAGFTLTICLAILCVGVVCLRRFSEKSKKIPDYKTLRFQNNSVESQPKDHRFLSDVAAAEYTGSDASSFVYKQQLPAYSVYVGESGLNEIDQSNSIQSGRL